MPSFDKIFTFLFLNTRNRYKALSPAVRKKFFDALSSHPFLNYLCHVAYFSGLRIGELLGLRWQDIDMKNKVLSVEHAITTKPEFDKLGNKLSKKTILSNPKTASSKTKLPMSNILVETLKEWKNIQRTKGRKLKMYLTGQKDFVFCNDDGTMRTYYGTKKIFYTFLKSHNLNKYHIHFHTLRHTFSNTLFEADQNPKVIQSLLGHKDVKTTITTYNSVDKSYFDKATKVFNEQYKIEQQEDKYDSLDDDELDWEIKQLLKEKEEREKRKRKREKDFEM